MTAVQGRPGTQSIFFYGLFMDVGLLQQKGLRATVTGPAQLPGYELCIGDRATLIPAAGENVFGMLIELPDADVERLYSEPGVADYRAASVSVQLLEDRSVRTALCYNLPETAPDSTINTSYARELSKLLQRLRFPEAYWRHVERLGNG